MSFARWSIILPTLIGAMFGLIFDTLSSQNGGKNPN